MWGRGEVGVGVGVGGEVKSSCKSLPLGRELASLVELG